MFLAANVRSLQPGGSIAETWPFFIFSRWRRLPSWILKVEIFNRWTCSESRYASTCQILCRSVERLRRYGRFSIFQDGGRPPSWICFTCIWTTLEEHLLVFVTVQNLVGIGAVVSIICQFLMFCEFGLKMPIHAPFWVVFVGYDPIDETQYQPILQRFHLRVIAVPAVYYLYWCL